MAIVISGVNNNDKITASDGTIDLLSGVNYTGIITAPSITASNNITAGNLNIGSNIQLGNAGVATATTFVGNLTGNVNATSNLLLQIGGSEKFRVASSGQLGIGGANYGTSGQVLTSGGSGSAATWSTISGTTINNNATTKFITGTNNANELDCEANLSYNNSLVTFSSSSLMVDKGTNPTISAKETAGNKEVQLRANTDGGLLRTVGNYPLIFGVNQVEKFRIDSSYAKIGINTNTFDNNGSQIKIEGRGTGTTTPPYLQIKGVGNANLHAYVDLIATSDSNVSGGNPSEYRGMGVVMHDEPSNKEWYAGRPYAGSDKFIIGRKASPSYRTQSAEVANELVRISSEGYVTKPEHPSFHVTKTNGDVSGNNYVVFNRVEHNNGSHYSTSNGRFTAPVTGVYIFHVWHYTGGTSAIALRINGSQYGAYHWDDTGGSAHWVCPMTAGQYAQIFTMNPYSFRGTSDYHNGFCGYLIG